MDTGQHISIENKIEYPLERLGNVDHMIYFDIETTGFSRKYCMVYMIGCMYFVNGEPIYTQWVAENANDEANVLMAFHKFIQNYKIILMQGFLLKFSLKIDALVPIFKKNSECYRTTKSIMR